MTTFRAQPRGGDVRDLRVITRKRYAAPPRGRRPRPSPVHLRGAESPRTEDRPRPGLETGQSDVARGPEPRPGPERGHGGTVGAA